MVRNAGGQASMSQAEVRRDTTHWQELDRRHYLHPFTDHKALGLKGSRIITRAEGVYLWDSEGQRILDAMSGLWCVNIGYGRRELAEAAYRQMLELPYYNSFFQSANRPAIELATVLVELAPENIGKVFFTGSGSESNDTVIRMVRRYWDLLGEPDRNVLISRVNAYHGSTMGGASLGGMAPMHAQGGLPIPGIEHIRQPYWYAEGGDLDSDEFGLLAARALAERIEALGPTRVAAFVAEPIQGAGGVIIPPASYWPEIQRICQHYGILLVVDEVICGFGRTGHWFGSDYYHLQPDFMPIAKGMSSGYAPIGGVLVSERVARVLVAEGGEFFHGFTYSGHPTACAVALENLRILKEEQLVERVERDTAPYLQHRWRELADHSLVGEARGVGMLCALELVQDKAHRKLFANPGRVGTICRDHCIENGLVMRAVRDTMVAAPPLVIDHQQVDEMIDKALLCLDLTAAQVHRQ
jgi:putrescine aminotransferase